MGTDDLLIAALTFVVSILSSIAIVGFSFGRLSGRVDGLTQVLGKLGVEHTKVLEDIARNGGITIEHGKLITNISEHLDNTPSKDDFRRLEDRFEILRREIITALNSKPA
jgi:hypothetical protein